MSLLRFFFLCTFLLTPNISHAQYYMDSNRNTVNLLKEISFEDYRDYVNSCITHAHLEFMGWQMENAKRLLNEAKSANIDSEQMMLVLQKEFNHTIKFPDRVGLAWYIINDISYNQNVAKDVTTAEKLVLKNLAKIQDANSEVKAVEAIQNLSKQHVECLVWIASINAYMADFDKAKAFLSAINDENKEYLYDVLHGNFLSPALKTPDVVDDKFNAYNSDTMLKGFFGWEKMGNYQTFYSQPEE